MDYIYDSDPENSLPQLLESDIDVDLLRDSLLVLSRHTRERLRQEVENTSLRRVFDISDTSELFALPKNPASSPSHGTIGEDLSGPIGSRGSEPIRRIETSENSLPNLVSESHEPIVVLTQDQSNDSNGPRSETLNASHSIDSNRQIVETRIGRGEENQRSTQNGGELNEGTFVRPHRSLRRRTFASMHPYIADQADYLEICSIESMNEMFNAESDLASVVKTLNYLYVRKKKRYPDEDRYRSANFYVHLGKNRVLALQGSGDSQAQDLLSSSQVSEGQAVNSGAGDGAGVADHDDVERGAKGGELDFSIPSTPDILSRLDASRFDESDDGSDDDDIRFLNQSQRSRYSSPEPLSQSENSNSSADSLSESEPEQLIKIGGRYRKLSKILKGVLPESAKRLSLFQQKVPQKTRKKKLREITPRKGLAQKKFGSLSAQSAQLEQELKSYGDDDDDGENGHPNHRVQAHFLEASPTLRQLSRQLSNLSYQLVSPEAHFSLSSLEDESEGEIDLFSLSGSSINQSHLEHTSFENDSELPHEKRVPVQKRINLGSARRLATSKAPAVKGPTKVRGPRLLKRKFHQTTFNIEETGSGGFKRSAPTPKTPSTPRTAASIDSKAKQRSTKIQQVLQPKQVAKQPQPSKQTHPSNHPGGFSNLDHKRTPNSSTFIYEIESLKKFVRTNRVPSFNAQRFTPTRDELFNGNPEEQKNPLLCDCSFSKLDLLNGSFDYFPGIDTVIFTLSKRVYTLGLYQSNESREYVSHFLFKLLAHLERAETFNNDTARDEIIKALPELMKWFLIVREKPSLEHLSTVTKILSLFSKFQTKQIRRSQCPIHSQILALYWILLRLDSTESSGNGADLEKYALDFWLLLFLSFLPDEVKEPLVHDSVMVMSTIFQRNRQMWWLSILEAISECVLVESLSDMLDLLFYLASLVPSSEFNWTPFFTALSMAKNDRYSETRHNCFDLFEALINRLHWPFEERVLTSIYSSLARRKFGNFKDEELTPRVLSGVIRSESDLFDNTVFERFLVLIYRYVSSVDTETKVKRLISKLLPSTALVYKKDHTTRAIFVNRVNLVMLLSQISSIDLSAQFKILLELISGSSDLKVYLKAADATTAYCEIMNHKNRPYPIECIVTCLKMSFDTYIRHTRAHNSTNKMLKLIGSIAQQKDDPDLKAEFVFNVFGNFDLHLLPDSESVNVLSLLLLTLNEPNKLLLKEKTMEELVNFQKNLLTFLSSRMSLLSDINIETHRELIELCIQLWNSSAQILKNRHWNVMMFQKFSYMGEKFAREQFLCFFALEYLNENKTHVRPDDILSIDKIFIRAFCASTINGYVVDLFQVLSRELKSIFRSTKWRQNQIDSMYALLANKFQILSDFVRNTLTSSRLSVVERESLISYLIECLHSEYNKSFHIAGYLELCKHLMELIRVTGKGVITKMSNFWDFAEKLGLLNREMQSTWMNLNDDEKLTAFHRELACSLQFEKDPLARMMVWSTEIEARVLFALLEIYADLLAIETAYWCHVKLLLEIILRRYRNFEISFSDGSFLKLMVVLKKLSFRSTNLTQFEVQSVSQSASLIEFGYFSYEGYLEQKDLVELARVFFANIDLDPSLITDQPRIFTTFSTEQILSGQDLNGRAITIPDPQQVYSACQKGRVNVYDVEFNNIQRIRQRLEFSAVNPLDFDFNF